MDKSGAAVCEFFLKAACGKEETGFHHASQDGLRASQDGLDLLTL
ncbi:CPSF4 isoform 4 [Pan troglodytes]|uniref:CPSF4 isoform 4 n=1 Tax=Pan troglodytes TaxID=9598 RepID=A0A2J8Q0B6_PANTR|nr:CPSF4 isoform 4 [Pan troglodytes]